MKRIGLILLAVVLMAFPLFSQNGILPDTLKIGKHTVAEWKYKSDTTWGDGMPTADKLILFDRFWEAVDTYYPGFVHNTVNWDSVKNHYRPEIEAGVSHGRFAGIISKMGLLMKEAHSGAFNEEVFLTKPDPGIPLLVSGAYITNDTTIMDHGRFGAGLTMMNDNRILVLRAVENHPMGLEAGDIVIGYDGVPWSELYRLLLLMDFPVTTNLSIVRGVNKHFIASTGSSEQSIHHIWMASAGLNWHLFDTLDFRKYGSSDTLHMPTNLLEATSFSISANEQFPVEGIEFPGAHNYPQYTPPAGLKPVIYDTIMDNTIGYIYYTHMMDGENGFRDLLKEAVDKLSSADLKGLIFDVRLNLGGTFGWTDALNSIFNQDFGTHYMSVRKSGGEHWELERFGSPPFSWKLYGDHYTKPIALLAGPGAVSNGDYVSYLIHIQPMVRSFGKSTNTGFTMLSMDGINSHLSYDYWYLCWEFGYPGWYFQIAPQNFTRVIDGTPEYLIHKGFEVDEEIWFTQEAAYHQKDNMVERAIEWIDSVYITSNININPRCLNINIYPNPTNDIVNIQTDGLGPYTITVISLSGQLLQESTRIGNSYQLDLSSFRKGVYIITIRSEGFVTTEKIIKL